MTKHFTLSLLFFCSILLTVAGPAKRVRQLTTLTDGTRVMTTLAGDEHFHYLLTDDGVPLRLLDNGMAERISDQEFTAFQQRASIRRQNANQRRIRRAQKANARGRNVKIAPSAPGTYRGKRKGLIILVNFSDTKMKETSTWDAFNDMMNKEGYDKNNHLGSLHDYFMDQSYGEFDLSFDVVGPVTVSQSLYYYGHNVGSDDALAATMVIEACRLADPFVNYADYDWDGDGEVDQVYVIYAGYSEAQHGPSYAIWPHEFTLTEAKDWDDGDGPIVLDGVTIDTYACSSELHGSSGSVMDGIGNACHEFSHCLGFPDLYDTGKAGNFGMDSWSLLDYGNYAGGGNRPVAYNAYERWYAGWLELRELTDFTVVKDMAPITSGKEAYVIRNQAAPDEYYILQNIQKEGWNIEAPGHGMLVLHVDYDPDIWEDNTINNVTSRQRCTIICADGRASGSENSLKGDPYPGTSGNRQLTDTSYPTASTYNPNTDGRKYMHMPITDIKEENGLISFNVCVPEGIDATVTNSELDSSAAFYTLDGRTLGGRTLIEGNTNWQHGLYIQHGRKHIK